MDLRELRALELAARCRIVQKDGAWQVPSQSGQGTYRVDPNVGAPSCTCEDFQLTRKPCKHILAVRFTIERDGGAPVPVLDTEVVPKKPTYAQNWPAYNLAQTTEKHRFQVLLRDLCQLLPEFPYKGGRQRTPVADAVFACVLKVYSTISSRRFNCDLQDAHKKGYLTAPMHCNRINACMEKAELTPILTGLVAQSALPLRAIETEFAPDSSGFSTSRFVRWFDEKYGVHRSGHDWVKVHLMCGTKTHVVTAIEIKDKDANDSPILPALLKTTAQSFTVRQVAADKGYSSAENIEAITAAGATPFIAFKSNATGGIGGLFEKAFHFYSLKREEFLKFYHQRSNVESVFSMVKRKFGDNVRSRTDDSMKNEVLCKFLAHNLCCLIMSQCELGIEATFWPSEVEVKPDVLPLGRPG